MADPIKSALDDAKAKLDKLVEDRRRIDAQIIDWKRVVDSLCAVCEDVSDTLPPDVEVIVRVQAIGPFQPPSDDNPNHVESPPMKLNFTDAIRTILRVRENRAVPVPEIRDELTVCGFDFSKYKQKLVPVHNALKRLEEQGEARAVKNEQGRVKGYQWIGSIERAMHEDYRLGAGAGGGLWDHTQGIMRESIRRLVNENENVRELFTKELDKKREQEAAEERAKAIFGSPGAAKYPRS
jgi:hypothetical protein